jgi:hypothetical protein
MSRIIALSPLRSIEVCSYCGADNPAYTPPVAPQQPASTDKRRGRGFLVFLVIVGLVGLALYIGAQEIAKTAERYGEDVVGLCDPIRGGQASLSNMPDDVSYPLRIVVFREEQPFIGSLHRDLRDEWRANDRSEVDVVVCVAEKQRRLVEECSYRVGDGIRVVVKRYQRYNDVILFNPDTTERIVELRVDGDLPDKCPERVTDDDRRAWDINGREMTFAQFETAIMPYIEP